VLLIQIWSDPEISGQIWIQILVSVAEPELEPEPVEQ
jgi:hypothetical protein